MIDDEESDGGLDERAAARKVVASSSDEDDKDSDVDTGVFDKRGRKRHDGGEGRKRSKNGQDKSRSSAMDEIHAESCRMLRESAVSIPYHREAIE